MWVPSIPGVGAVAPIRVVIRLLRILSCEEKFNSAINVAAAFARHNVLLPWWSTTTASVEELKGAEAVLIPTYLPFFSVDFTLPPHPRACNSDRHW